MQCKVLRVAMNPECVSPVIPCYQLSIRFLGHIVNQQIQGRNHIVDEGTTKFAKLTKQLLIKCSIWTWKESQLFWHLTTLTFQRIPPMGLEQCSARKYKTIWEPVVFASRSLTEIEQRFT